MRAERRHHRSRLKANRRRYWGRGRDLLTEPRAHAKVVDTPAMCSCFMCGNPRRHFNLRTIAERAADQERLHRDE